MVFALPLADTDVDTAIVGVDRVLHRVIPIVMMADWLIEAPTVPIDFRRALWWLIFPVAWVIYTMGRGAMVGTYPYPFLDPASGGDGTVFVYAIAIFIGMLVFTYHPGAHLLGTTRDAFARLVADAVASADARG